MSASSSVRSSHTRKIAILAIGYQQYEVHGCYQGASHNPSHYRVCEAGKYQHQFKEVDTFPNHRTLRQLFDH